MLKYLILAGLLYGVYFLFFKKTNPLNDKSKKDKKDSQTMVECVKCGTFVSSDEAFISNGRYFCSKECLDAYTGA